MLTDGRADTLESYMLAKCPTQFPVNVTAAYITTTFPAPSITKAAGPTAVCHQKSSIGTKSKCQSPKVTWLAFTLGSVYLEQPCSVHNCERLNSIKYVLLQNLACSKIRAISQHTKNWTYFSSYQTEKVCRMNI